MATLVGYATITYQGAVYPDCPIYYIKRSSARKSFYSPEGVGDLPLKKIRLYLRRKMSNNFNNVIKPLFEGQPVYLGGLNKRAGGEFGQLFIFKNDKVPYYLDTPYYQGSLEFYHPNEDQTNRII